MKLENLPIGKTLIASTKNTEYRIERREDGFYVSGNPKYCPEPTKVRIDGSTFGGSMLKAGFVGRGMNLEFLLVGSGKPVTTSPIQEVYIEGEKPEIPE
jgi:hypothetical protein